MIKHNVAEAEIYMLCLALRRWRHQQSHNTFYVKSFQVIL